MFFFLFFRPTLAAKRTSAIHDIQLDTKRRRVGGIWVGDALFIVTAEDLKKKQNVKCEPDGPTLTHLGRTHVLVMVGKSGRRMHTHDTHPPYCRPLRTYTLQTRRKKITLT
jgi:hypothetical protein